MWEEDTKERDREKERGKELERETVDEKKRGFRKGSTVDTASGTTRDSMLTVSRQPSP